MSKTGIANGYYRGLGEKVKNPIAKDHPTKGDSIYPPLVFVTYRTYVYEMSSLINKPGSSPIGFLLSFAER